MFIPFVTGSPKEKTMGRCTAKDPQIKIKEFIVLMFPTEIKALHIKQNNIIIDFFLWINMHQVLTLQVFTTGWSYNGDMVSLFARVSMMKHQHHRRFKICTTIDHKHWLKIFLKVTNLEKVHVHSWSGPSTHLRHTKHEDGERKIKSASRKVFPTQQKERATLSSSRLLQQREVVHLFNQASRHSTEKKSFQKGKNTEENCNIP